MTCPGDARSKAGAGRGGDGETPSEMNQPVIQGAQRPPQQMKGFFSIVSFR